MRKIPAALILACYLNVLFAIAKYDFSTRAGFFYTLSRAPFWGDQPTYPVFPTSYIV
jgi:hypothetical protein